MTARYYNQPMRIAELWRYPVKSLAGERLKEADLRQDGIVGDRIYQVRRLDGKIIDARAHPKMLALHPTLTHNLDLFIDGKPWDSPQMAEIIEDAAASGPGAHLERRVESERFDVLPLLIATDGAVAALGYDHRRLRPNILIADVEGLSERDWPGRALRVGVCLIGIRRLRERCVMTTWDPDTQEQSPEVFQKIQNRFDGRIALDSWVIRGGTIRLGDTVEVVDREGQRPRESDWGRYASEKTRQS
jgi:MOSC domain-containing protein